MLIKSVPYLINKRITPKVKLVPEAQPRDTNGRVVLFPLTILGRKHILMARSIAEGPIFKHMISYPQNRPINGYCIISINCRVLSLTDFY